MRKVAFIKHQNLSNEQAEEYRRHLQLAHPQVLEVTLLTMEQFEAKNYNLDLLINNYDVFILPLTLPYCHTLNIAKAVCEEHPDKKLLLLSRTQLPSELLARVFHGRAYPDIAPVELVRVFNKMFLENHASVVGEALDAALDTIRSQGLNKTKKECGQYVHLRHNIRRRVLHLSDIHLGTEERARVSRVQLRTDLKRNLLIDRLDYVILSGDIADRATKEEYRAAREMVGWLAEEFHVPAGHVIAVPGNHDVNWDASGAAYEYRAGHLKPSKIADTDIDLGAIGLLRRDETRYRERFRSFSEEFYVPTCGQPYPEEYEAQASLHAFPEDRMLFLTLNSSWQLDHHYRQRISIHAPSLYNALERADDFPEWLKIAVWHHPPFGREAVANPEILEQLALSGFQVTMHGHVHEASRQLHYYWNYGLYVVGAGTFGAPADQQVPGVAHQYNLLEYEPAKPSIRVWSRRKVHSEGAWEADYIWSSRENGRRLDREIEEKRLPYYDIMLRKPH